MNIFGYFKELFGLKWQLVLWFIKKPYECAVIW
jgi:hypothetical protein